MELLTANSGSYPRIGDGPGEMRLRKAYQKWEENQISDEELEEVYRDYTAEVIREQEEAGLDVVTDGQLRWYDPLSHLAKNIGGCEVDGLLRYFDTNFYVRQPVVVDNLTWEDPLLIEEYQFAKDIAQKLLKPVITGPYTLANYSINRHYNSLSDLTLDYAEIVAREIERLVQEGAEEIQIDEPAILKNQEDFDIFSEAMDRLALAKKDARLDLYVYFADSAPFYEKLQDLPVDLLGLDFTYSPRLPDLIEEKGSEKGLGLGLIDARNTKMEDQEEIISVIKKILPGVNADRAYLNPSCGLEFLPREIAREKLENMVEIAERTKEMR
ncbi:hypothetical protein AKJ41_03575 [candidate division MSBL1 archaeon SCGC-AAA259O05]|uniref:Cobalamin-independent methionine synthase MetE C-terminal/archaeal domain-containing protein n=1 Tax=candidate division MSBL1 archaeon SCGC-AAA259O05 TaxID=1698271 RepID=A0A133V333_9EURY|nr:hypothetical protein AKJ41_03575 [candidate division MSBL1 archaeon SCGC-AAA259O05]